MRLLITGGLGHIGSYLSIEPKIEITVVDNLLTQRYCSLFHRNFHFIEKDFNDLTPNFLKNFHFVIHLAAITDATNSFNNKDIDKINVNDTYKFLQKCATAKVKVIFPSSTSVYGVSKETMYEDDSVNPQSPYAESKLAIEQLLPTLSLDYVILRLGTISGVSPGMRFHTAINKFCYQACFNQKLTVWKSNLNLVRPYLSLSDLRAVLYYILDNWVSFSKSTYNVLTSNFSTQSILDIIKEHINIQVEYTDCPLLNQYSYEVSNKKLMNKLPFYQTITSQSIKKDIKDTIELLRS